MKPANNWKKYRRKGIVEMRPYVEGEDLLEVSISWEDIKKGRPQKGGHDWQESRKS